MTLHIKSSTCRSNSNSLSRLSGAKGRSCGSNREHSHGGLGGVLPCLLHLLPQPPPPPPPPLLPSPLPPPILPLHFPSRPIGLFLPRHPLILLHRQPSPRSLVQKRKAMFLFSLGTFRRQRRACNRTNKAPYRQRQTPSNTSCMITLL